MREAFRWITVNSREYLECVPLASRARHLFSTRQLELPADHAARKANLEVFARDLGVAPAALLRVRQVHSCRVRVVENGTPDAGGPIEADGLVSAIRGTACTVQVADCVPILIAAGPDVRAVGGSERGAVPVAAVHAGWRGTASGVALEAVRALERLGANASTLVAALGPSIGPCCYQVDARVREAFERSPHWDVAESAFAADGEGHWRLDVARINRAILEKAGVPAGQIYDSGLCTACDLARFYSYRAEGAATGRLIAGIVAE